MVLRIGVAADEDNRRNLRLALNEIGSRGNMESEL